MEIVLLFFSFFSSNCAPLPVKINGSEVRCALLTSSSEGRLLLWSFLGRRVHGVLEVSVCNVMFGLHGVKALARGSGDEVKKISSN